MKDSLKLEKLIRKCAFYEEPKDTDIISVRVSKLKQELYQLFNKKFILKEVHEGIVQRARKGFKI